MSLGPLPSDSTKSSPTAAEEKIILGTTKPKLFPGAIAGILIAVFGASDPQFFSPHRTQSKIPSGLGHNHRSPFLLPLGGSFATEDLQTPHARFWQNKEYPLENPATAGRYIYRLLPRLQTSPRSSFLIVVH